MIKNQFVFIHHIDDAIRDIEDYKKDVATLLDFKSDTKTQDAIVRKLEIIGEAINNITDGFMSQYPEIDWKGPINLRNIISHEYFDINLKTIWKLFDKDIPTLKTQIQEILKNEK